MKDNLTVIVFALLSVIPIAGIIYMRERVPVVKPAPLYLEWDQPLTGNEGPIAYFLKIDDRQERQVFLSTTDGKTFRTDISNLPAGRHSFALRACNKSGCSEVNRRELLVP